MRYPATVIATRISSLRHLQWFGWPTLLAAVLLTHFVISACNWIAWLIGTAFNPYFRHRLLEYLADDWLCFSPAFVLLTLSFAAFAFAFRRRPVSWRLSLLVALAAVLFFALDVHFRHYQHEVFIATDEYWRSRGKAHVYYTWWWYNDLWFRSALHPAG